MDLFDKDGGVVENLVRAKHVLKERFERRGGGGGGRRKEGGW